MIVANNTSKEFDWIGAVSKNTGVAPINWYKNEIKNFNSNISTYTKELCKDGTTQTQEHNELARIMDACRNNGGRAETFFKVICNDGTTQMVSNEPEKGVSNQPCTKNGGVSKNKIIEKQEVIYAPEAVRTIPVKSPISQDKEDNFWKSVGFTQSGMIKPKHKGRFYLVVALVAGYFAYKKFKK